jgi:hypothetical protein
VAEGGSMTDHTVSSIEEWSAWADSQDEPRAQLVGDLADQIRARFGANKHAAVWLSQGEEYNGCADGCCNDSYRWLGIECGDHMKRLDFSYADVWGRLADWFDEPRRQAERAAAKAAKEQAQRENSAVFDQTVLRPVADAIQQVEAEGYRDDQDWHDKLMSKLGVKGYQ